MSGPGFRLDQIDRQLGEWLRDESMTVAPSGLIEDVFARTARTPQVRRWWTPVRRRRAPERRPHLVSVGRAAPAWRGGALAGALGLALVAVIVALTLRPGGPGPASSGAPPTAVPSPSRSSPSPSGSSVVTPRPSPTPVATAFAGLTARHLSLGVDAGPIAVTDAFGSIWVADIHANDVRRFEPATMRELARIPVPGAAWFAVADGALWVTSQTGTGLSRIDPATNTVVAHVGDVQPCSAPVVVGDSIWQAACDSGVFIRIDPSRNAVVQSVPTGGDIFLVMAAGKLLTAGSQGLARLDPGTGALTSLPNPAAAFPDLLASDGTTVWAKNAAGFVRIDPSNGRTIGAIAESDAQGITFAGDHAWVTVRRKGVLEVDLATNKVRRTIPVLPSPNLPLEADGVLWVTDFDGSELWRVDLARSP